MGAWLHVERTEKRRSNRNESMIDDEQRGEYRKNLNEKAQMGMKRESWYPFEL